MSTEFEEWIVAFFCCFGRGNGRRRRSLRDAEGVGLGGGRDKEEGGVPGRRGLLAGEWGSGPYRPLRQDICRVSLDGSHQLDTTVYVPLGQKDYLPNLYSRRIILGNSMCFYVCERELLGELMLNYLTKITLPKSVSN